MLDSFQISDHVALSNRNNLQLFLEAFEGADLNWGQAEIRQPYGNVA